MAEEKDWEDVNPTEKNDNKESRVLFSFKEFFGVFRDFIALCKEMGPIRIAGYVVFFLFTAYAVHIGTHPDIIFEKYEEYAEQRHTESFNYRMKTSPQVSSLMDQLRMESGSMRAFIIEMHNGKYNSAGLSFNYGALTYESDMNGAVSIMDDYIDFSLERYPMLGNIYEDGFWGGSIETMKKEDHHLAYKLESNDAKYFAGAMIFGEKDAIGFIGVTYDTTDVDSMKIKRLLLKYSAKVGPLLDGTQAGKNKK